MIVIVAEFNLFYIMKCAAYYFDSVDMILYLTTYSNCRVGQFTSRILLYQLQQLYLTILNQTGVGVRRFFVL